MKKLMLLMAALMLVGCKGEKGETGMTGLTGATGPGAPTSGTYIYSGAVTSDNQLVKNLGTFDASKGDFASVDICTAPGTNTFCAQLGNVQVSTAAYYLAYPSTINLLHAQSNGFANYSITIVQPANRSN